MKTEELSEEQKRVKIAVACGWTKIGPKGFGSSELVGADTKDPAWPFSPLPDYFHDLNACAEMEKALTYEQCSEYFNALGAIQAADTTGRNGETEYPAQDFWFHATAAQRAEAFGLALGLWK